MPRNHHGVRHQEMINSKQMEVHGTYLEHGTLDIRTDESLIIRSIEIVRDRSAAINPVLFIQLDPVYNAINITRYSGQASLPCLVN